MERKTYRDKLLDPRWQKRRLEILGAANFTCRDCGSTTKTLHVHHVRYMNGREPWEYEDNFLRCVCEDCHREHAEADQMVAGALGDIELMMHHASLRAKFEAADALNSLAGMIYGGDTDAVLALCQLMTEHMADIGCGDQRPLERMRMLLERSHALYAVERGRYL